MSQKLAAYPHLYSFTSTKSVVHWFQIIRNKSFQLYDDDAQAPFILNSATKYTKVARFPTRNIKTPIVLVYGGSDSLVDIGVMLKELPSHTVAIEIPHFEHLDFLWAREVDTLVFPHVLDALQSFSDSDHSKEDFAKYRAARHASLGPGSQRPKSMGSSHADVATLSPNRVSDALAPLKRENSGSTIPVLAGSRKRAKVDLQDDGNEYDSSSSAPVAHTTSRAVEDLRKPAGFSDGAEDGDSSSTAVSTDEKRVRKKGSDVSLASLKGSLRAGKGISVGVGKAVGGVISLGIEGLEGVGNVTGSDTDSHGQSRGDTRKR